MVSHPCIVAAAAAVVLVLLIHADGGDGLLFRANAVWNSVRGGRPPQHFYTRRPRLRINSETASSTIVPETAELIPFSAFERAAEMQNIVKEEPPLPPGFEGYVWQLGCSIMRYCNHLPLCIPSPICCMI